jgi:HK97 family phage prohead protease
MTDLSARAEPGFQRRSFTATDLELRDGGDADTWTFEGVACTVDYPYTVRDSLGEFTETIAPGAFDRTLSNQNNRVSLFVNHGWRFGNVPLATTRAGTLSLVADPHLRVKATLDPGRPDVQIMRSAIVRGEMSEMSIGFNDVKDGVQWNDDYTARTVTEAALREASVTEEGANDATTASIRSLIVDLSRARAVDYDEAELRRAIAHLESLLLTPDTVVEVEERSGLLVTDELLSLFQRRLSV